MKTLRLGTLGLLALASSACGGLDVVTDWDPSFDFAAPQTFTVLDEASGQPLDRLNDQRVKNAIATVMEAKGFRQVADTTQADLAVGYQFTTEQRSSYQTVNTGWSSYGYGGYGGWYRYGGPTMTTSRTTETRYDVGSLLIAVFDTEQRAMVFTSTGSRTLSDAQRSPEEAQRRIDDAVEEILWDFPPGR
jgi:uncharacterized GH25 family protein